MAGGAYCYVEAAGVGVYAGGAYDCVVGGDYEVRESIRFVQIMQ